jgi:alpha-galactosidase
MTGADKTVTDQHASTRVRGDGSGTQSVTIDAGAMPLEISLDGLTCTGTSTRDGVTTLDLVWAAGPGCREPRLTWRWPLMIPATVWWPASEHVTVLGASWNRPVGIDAVSGAPVGSLVDLDDDNVLTYALSIAGASIDVVAGLEEETNAYLVTLTVPERASEIASGSFQLRIDARQIHFAEVLSDVETWWQGQLADELLPVPAQAESPAYSTWYSMHQHVTPAAIRVQAEHAREMGCEVIIVDDGWQTINTGRGYGYCGDWDPSSVFADMRGHVRGIQRLGMKYMLWYAPPLLGKYSRAASTLAEYTLGWDEGLNAYILDPRFPQVRQHLAGTILGGIRDFGLDGVKLDFLDHFARFTARPREGADCETVGEGVERLLQAIIGEGRELRPDLLVEFRQPYIGPRMWQYGNLLRAADCPFDVGLNRVRTVDLRLLHGNRAVHSDMLMWNPDGSAEAAALQLVNVLFSVPQISVLIDRLPQNHRDMLAYWITFTQTHRDVLLHGVIRPRRPDLRYPLVDAERDGRRVSAVYSDMPVGTAASLREHVIVNGTQRPGLIVRTASAWESNVTIRDCYGNLVDHRHHALVAYGTNLAVPVAGSATLTPVRT